jgi:hypothetical protein
MMAELNPQPLPPRAVRINVTPDIAFDIDKTERIRRSVLEQLGCPGCTSGHVLDFHVLDEFVVHPENLNVTPVVGR